MSRLSDDVDLAGLWGDDDTTSDGGILIRIRHIGLAWNLRVGRVPVDCEGKSLLAWRSEQVLVDRLEVGGDPGGRLLDWQFIAACEVNEVDFHVHGHLLNHGQDLGHHLRAVPQELLDTVKVAREG